MSLELFGAYVQNNESDCDDSKSLYCFDSLTVEKCFPTVCSHSYEKMQGIQLSKWLKKLIGSSIAPMFNLVLKY